VPSFDYKCPNEKCDNRECDVITVSHDELILMCPKCNTRMVRIYAAPNLIFNGGGWTPRYGGMNE
jgi:predicted nucleic acid-binding Zn ribbon protein